MHDTALSNALHLALNKLAKWRVVFTGWQLGTRAKGDPECDAVRDHREVTIILRSESSALVGLLIKKGVFTEREWAEAWLEEAKKLDADYERKFPGIKTDQNGVTFSLPECADTMKGWKP